MSSINDWCSQAKNIQKLECINNKNIKDQKTINTVTTASSSITTSPSTTSLDSTSSSLPPYKDAMSIIVPISVMGVILLFTIITCVTIRFIKNYKSNNSNSSGSSNNQLLFSSSQTKLTSNMQQDEGEDYGGGGDSINNDSVIDINNNYYNDNNDGDMINKMMCEINGEKYYNGIKVPPLGARIIPLERQMEISKELSEKHNYYQYYDNRSD